MSIVGVLSVGGGDPRPTRSSATPAGARWPAGDPARGVEPAQQHGDVVWWWPPTAPSSRAMSRLSRPRTTRWSVRSRRGLAMGKPPEAASDDVDRHHLRALARRSRARGGARVGARHDGTDSPRVNVDRPPAGGRARRQHQRMPSGERRRSLLAHGASATRLRPRPPRGAGARATRPGRRRRTPPGGSWRHAGRGTSSGSASAAVTPGTPPPAGTAPWRPAQADDHRPAAFVASAPTTDQSRLGPVPGDRRRRPVRCRAPRPRPFVAHVQPGGASLRRRRRRPAGRRGRGRPAARRGQARR